MDGELRSPFRLVPPCEDELPEQVVQRAPEEVRKLAKDDTPPQGWWPAAHAKDILARVRLEVSDEAAVFTTKKPRDFVEGVQVLVCSTNLEPAAM